MAKCSRTQTGEGIGLRWCFALANTHQLRLQLNSILLFYLRCERFGSQQGFGDEDFRSCWRGRGYVSQQKKDILVSHCFFKDPLLYSFNALLIYTPNIDLSKEGNMHLQVYCMLKPILLAILLITSLTILQNCKKILSEKPKRDRGQLTISSL